MKNVLLIFLLLPVFAFAQKDSNISVVSLEKANVIYRGINNPVKIAVPGAKSFLVTSESGGIKQDSIYTSLYNITPSYGNEFIVKIDAIMADGTRLREEKKFKIKSIPVFLAGLNGEYCSNCIYQVTKESFANATITITLPGVLFQEPLIAKSFSLTVINRSGKVIKEFDINGSGLNKEAIDYIKKLKTGYSFLIDKVAVDVGIDYRISRINTIVIDLID